MGQEGKEDACGRINMKEKPAVTSFETELRWDF